MAIAHKGESRARAQVVTPRSSRRAVKPRSRQSSAKNIARFLQSAARFTKPAAFLAVVALLILGYNAMADSRLFELRQVEVNNADQAMRANIEQIVRRAVGQTRLLGVDIASIKQKVEALPRVRAATVARVLPDRIYVSVNERQPTVLVRRESKSIVWLDEDGTEMGDVSEFKPGEGQIPPVLSGFSEGNRSQANQAEDRERIALYKQIEREFSDGPNPVWHLLDEIDLTFTKDVNIRLASPPVTVHVGSKDFRNRFETALKILDAIRKGDAELLGRFRIEQAERLIENANNINFIDAAKSDRIVLNFATPGTKEKVRQEPKKK